VIPDPSPKADKDSSGTIILTSNVEDAEIYLGGVFVGNAPSTLKLKPSVYVIEVQKKGYLTYRKELRLLPLSEVSLKAVMEKAPKKSDGP
jgi:hypothetical protein